MNIVAIIQARMGSARLPGKVMMDLDGMPMLERVVRRVKRAKKLSNVIVATTTNPIDQQIISLCEWLDIPVTRGSEEDVLDRYYQTAVQYEIDIIVRITADCPITDPALIDDMVGIFTEETGLDYLSNTKSPRAFPRGLDIEVIWYGALQRAWMEDKNPLSREHVTPYIYGHPELFILQDMGNYRDLSYLRLTVDTYDDLALLQAIFTDFGHDNFKWQEVVELLDNNPELRKLNTHVIQKEFNG